MPLLQASLAAVIFASGVGSYYGILSSPNPNPKSAPSTGDSMSSLFVPRFGQVIRASFSLVVIHTAGLAYSYPNIPPFLLRQGEYSLNVDLITWSAATSIPLALIFLVGLPLRLGSFASLGRNFTFALKEPDRLNTGGMYRYLQHPGYTGGGILVFCNMALLGRFDGALCCLIWPRYIQSLVGLQWIIDVIFVCMFGLAIYTRVREEERMLKAKFGVEWESWHTRTARFVPWII
ncbi:hypothetical protein AUP68_00420 [Ilyonectria robusta]